jgi:hypothetical protein
MALITDPQAVAFENTECRQWAEKYLGAYFDAVRMLDKVTAQGLTVKIPNTADTFQDGAGVGSDGRPVVTGAMVNVLLAHMANLKTLMEANSNLVLNQCFQLAVTPR